jgi:Holliday junction resolvase RusA-like endonuclease
MTEYNFAIAELTPSLNKLVKGRTHWSEYRRWQKDWFYRVKLATQDIEIPLPAPQEKRKIEVTSYRVSLLDPDNLKGGMKLLLDALVDAMLIYDDGPKFLEFPDPGQVQVRKHKLEQTVVRLTIF